MKNNVWTKTKNGANQFENPIFNTLKEIDINNEKINQQV